MFRLGTVALQERGINSWKGTCVRGFAVGFENVKTLENEREREIKKGSKIERRLERERERVRERETLVVASTRNGRLKSLHAAFVVACAGVDPMPNFKPSN